MHKQIDDHGKSHRQQSAVQEADRFDVSSKHYRIHFHSQNNISVQENSNRALITDPKLILADEPTGALDSKAASALLSMFGEINAEGQTILMVTHSAQAASHASRVLFIKDGEVFHQIYKGSKSRQEMYQMIADTLTILTTGGEHHA